MNPSAQQGTESTGDSDDEPFEQENTGDTGMGSAGVKKEMGLSAG